ncbi:TPA: hypothetical protein UMF63_000730 [Stenotrophomonas maltophilia]|uniref:hypothetical protein n=1 Tax=Stenotrophomonas maltophilia TaxID=40324 RepID=UPI001585FBB7|nr:hypothetical protein [Stenotrophomonas maltophilia]
MKLPKVPWKNMAAIGDSQNSVHQDQAHAALLRRAASPAMLVARVLIDENAPAFEAQMRQHF